MRHTLLASAALLGLAVAVPAFAQTAQDTTTPPAASAPAAAPAAGTTGNAMPMRPHMMGAQASNIGASDTRSDIAPALPVPPLGPDATPQQFLSHAQMALQQHRSGEAQEALERAETRLLDRSTMPSAADQPDMAPMVKQIAQALDALGRRDWPQANQLIADMLKNPTIAAGEGGTMGGGGMTNGSVNGATGVIGAGGSDMNSGTMGTMPAANGAPQP